MACESLFEEVAVHIDLDIHGMQAVVVVAVTDHTLGLQEAGDTLARTPAADTEVVAESIAVVVEVAPSSPSCNCPPFAVAVEEDACHLLDPSCNRVMTLELRASLAWAFAFAEGRDVVDRFVVPSSDCKDQYPFAVAAIVAVDAYQSRDPPSLLPSHLQPHQQRILCGA